MTATRTYTATFNINHARYVTSKVKTDLKLLQGAYGAPSDSSIDDFGEEAALLLRDGYLGTVTYGFRRHGNWVLALHYVAQNDGTLADDDRAGRVPRGVDINGAVFHSYLTYSGAWHVLTWEQKQSVEASLPLNRTSADPPGTSGGYWTTDKSYSSNGTGVGRSTYRPL